MDFPLNRKAPFPWYKEQVFLGYIKEFWGALIEVKSYLGTWEVHGDLVSQWVKGSKGNNWVCCTAYKGLAILTKSPDPPSSEKECWLPAELKSCKQ